MTARQKEHALWVACAAAAVVYAIYAGPIGPIEGAALWCSVVAGRYAAVLGERRKAAATVRHHHAAALRSAAQGLEAAARAHGDHGIYGTLTYEQAATILRETAAQRDKDQP